MTNKSSCCFLRNLNGSSPCDIFRIDRNFDALNSIFNDLIITVRRTRRCNRTRTSKNIPALARREISFFDTSAVRGLRDLTLPKTDGCRLILLHGCSTEGCALGMVSVLARTCESQGCAIFLESQVMHLKAAILYD